MSDHETSSDSLVAWIGRRKMLAAGFIAAAAGAYSAFASLAVQFVFPATPETRRSRVFLAFAQELPSGQSKALVMPSGDQLLLSNTGRINASTGNTFIAFSNSCPHLGCRVHWDSGRSEFICPCHQGIFDATGTAISGPPAQSNKGLKPYEIEVAGDSIYAIVENS